MFVRHRLKQNSVTTISFNNKHCFISLTHAHTHTRTVTHTHTHYRYFLSISHLLQFFELMLILNRCVTLSPKLRVFKLNQLHFFSFFKFNLHFRLRWFKTFVLFMKRCFLLMVLFFLFSFDFFCFWLTSFWPYISRIQFSLELEIRKQSFSSFEWNNGNNNNTNKNDNTTKLATTTTQPCLMIENVPK